MNVYTGVDGSFDLSEDDGRSYVYEQGEWSRISLRYDDSEGLLTIGRRIGAFRGMAEQGKIQLRWLGCGAAGADFDEAVAATLDYDGPEAKLMREPLPCD